MSVELRNVVKRAGADTHIYETSLSLEPGKFNVLLGTTLAGKTTLMRLMAGLEKPTQGEVWCDGKNVTGVLVRKRSVAMVYQAFINYPSFTIFDNIASPLKVAGLSDKEIKEKVLRIADVLKLTPMLNRQPSELSGGQQQRTALARALVKEADLVLLDEPLANLDYKLREELREELPKLFADTGATVVYATSEPLEALMLGGYTATVSQGRVIQYGETAKLFREPRTLESARVFSDPPINTATVEKWGGKISLNADVSWDAPPHISSLADGSYTVALRAYQLLPQGEGVKVQGLVQASEISGSETTVRMLIGAYTWVSETHGIQNYSAGQLSEFNFDPDRCLYFDADEKYISR
ncbi:MAG: ABC transporter ATP-binding protein [Desulfobacterales bacterium]|nr:ABC transporter ATP-binding protein [Desulfobacterales bacterium]